MRDSGDAFNIVVVEDRQSLNLEAYFGLKHSMTHGITPNSVQAGMAGHK